MDKDYILCECALEPLEKFVCSIEPNFNSTIVLPPTICMVMIQAEDSVELQPFYLGEALATECQVMVNGFMGYGLCLGDEPVRSYCIALIDAIAQLPKENWTSIEAFLQQQATIIEQEKLIEHNQILATKVDFKIMEQA